MYLLICGNSGGGGGRLTSSLRTLSSQLFGRAGHLDQVFNDLGQYEILLLDFDGASSRHIRLRTVDPDPLRVKVYKDDAALQTGQGR